MFGSSTQSECKPYANETERIVLVLRWMGEGHAVKMSHLGHGVVDGDNEKAIVVRRDGLPQLKPDA